MSDGMTGQFIWHELVTTDAKSAAGFYSKVASLKTKAAEFQPTYTLLTGSGRPMGGLITLADAAKAMGASAPHWLSFVGAANVDETARRAESLGGHIVSGPGPVPDGGRYAVLQDPQGAVFAIYGNRDGQGGATSDIPLGHSSWHELATTDHVAAFSFYQQLFGWVMTSEMDMGPQGSYRMFAPTGAKDPFGGMYTKAPGSPGGPNWLPYIKVADARPATVVAKKNGAQILNGPMQVPGGGWITMGIDPQGVAFALHSVAAATPAKKKAAMAKGKVATKSKRKATKKIAKKKSAPKTKAKKMVRKRAGSKK